MAFDPPLSFGLLDSSPIALQQEAEYRKQAKKALRKRMRGLRASIPESARALRSQALVHALLNWPVLQGARSLALFWPLLEKAEPDVRSLGETLRSRGIRTYYPVQEDRGEVDFTGFRLVTADSELQLGRGKFEAPPPSAPLAARGEVDLILVPALAVSAEGHRIGYGAGYYDATLPDLCPPAQTAILAFDFQLLGELPHEPHDLACDYVVTDARILKTNPT